MNSVFAVAGCPPWVAERMLLAAEQLGGTAAEVYADRDRSVVVGCSRAGPAGVITSVQPGRAVAAYGCAARSGHDAAALLGDHDTSNRLLDGASSDLVALATDSTGLTIAAGRGNHRLFTARIGNGWIVASHLGLLARTLGNAHVDRGHEDFVLGFGFVPGHDTVYEGISWLPAGTRRRIPDGESEPIRPPDLEPTPIPASFDDAVDTLHDLMLAASSGGGTVGRVAVLLGGLDSALVAALLRRSGHEVDTFTFGFGDDRYEQRNAASFSRGIGATHHWIPIGPEIIMDGLRDFADLSHQT